MQFQLFGILYLTSGVDLPTTTKIQFFSIQSLLGFRFVSTTAVHLGQGLWSSAVMPVAGVLHNGHLGVAVDFDMQQDTPMMDDIFNVLFPASSC